jgi:dihydrofolate reductase
MATVTISTAITVDGVMSVEDWYVPGGGHHRAGLELFDRAAAMLLGRKNYEGLAGYWAPETGPWAERINPLPKYVASRTLREPLTWNASLLEGDLGEAVSRLKGEFDGELLSVGCGELARSLLAYGVVDELRFWIHPAVWGGGERPFFSQARLRLVPLGAETFDSGVTLVRYAPAPGVAVSPAPSTDATPSPVRSRTRPASGSAGACSCRRRSSPRCRADRRRGRSRTRSARRRASSSRESRSARRAGW